MAVEHHRGNPHTEFTPPAPQFFVNQKRGEINELRILLRSLPAENDNNASIKAKRREVLKKLIAYMTLGIDVSPLFPEVVLASATNDPVQKKLLALYMGNYAELNPDLSILAINALQKDLLDVDPRIRGLALKALSSLRVPSIVEYAESAVRQGLEDPASYVRRSALMGVLKLLDGTKADVTDRDALVASVRRCLFSLDPQLFINSLLVLNEVEGGFQANRKTIVHLFNKLPGCPSFGRVLVLSLMADFTPRDEKEMLGLLDALEANFSVSNVSLLLSTVKVMLIFAKSQLTDSTTWTTSPLILSILRRVKPSLITLMNSSSMESVYVILIFIHQLLRLSPHFVEIFKDDWQSFVLRHIDKSVNKQLKLCILSDIATESTWMDIKSCIMTALTPPTCVSLDVLQMALKVLGNLAVKFDGAAPNILEELAFLTTLDIPTVTAAVTPVIALILSKFTELADDTLPLLNLVKLLETPSVSRDALRAAVWMAGEFPHATPCVTELVEQLTQSIFESGDFVDQGMLLNDILMSCCKIIYSNPEMIKPAFAALLQKIAENLQRLPPLVVDRFMVIRKLLMKKPRLLNPLYSGDALKEEQSQRKCTNYFYSVSVYPEIPLHRLDTLRSVVDEAQSIDFLKLPFGGFYANYSSHQIDT